MSFTNMKIGARMGAGFGLVLVLVLLVAAFGLIRMSQIQGHLDQVTGDHMVKIKLVGTMRDTLQTVAISVRNLVLLTDDGAMEAEAKRIQAERTQYAEASRKLAAKESGVVVFSWLVRIVAARAKTDTLLDKTMGYALGNPIAATQVLVGEARPAQEQWIKALDDMAGLQEKGSARAVADAEAAYASARVFMLFMMVLSLGLGSLAAWLITRSISTPIKHAVKLARIVSTGDLTQRIDIHSTDEVGQLMQALKDMNASLVFFVGLVCLCFVSFVVVS